MKRWQKRSLLVAGTALVLALAGMMVIARSHALALITNAPGARQLSTKTPADYDLPFDDVVVTTADGLKLTGWFVPSANGATVMVQHGYKDPRSHVLRWAKLLHKHGYGVLIGSVRAHDASEGELISFGLHEMKDLAAWHSLLKTRAGVDPTRLGIVGLSMGGALAIQFAAQTPDLRAVVADCAFSSLEDTIDTSVEFFTGLPSFPFGSMILFWTERRIGFAARDIDAKRWIGKISPRPILLIQGGADRVISPESGQRLFDAAGEPRELWFEPATGHVDLLTKMPDEYERRLITYLNRHLLAR